MTTPRHPALFQFNTRVWLTRRSDALGHKATLDDIPDAELDRLAGMGFDPQSGPTVFFELEMSR